MIKPILLIVFIFFINSTYAQLLVRKGDCYIYNNEEYTESKDIQDLFSYNVKALDWHLKSKRSKNAADVFGFSAVLGFFATYLIVRADRKRNVMSPDPNYTGFMVALISCGLGTIGIINKYDWASRADKAVDIFNGASFGDLYQNEPYEISFGITGNGIGFNMAF